MINELLNFIGKAFSGLDARDLLCMAQIILAVIKERTVNLAKLSMHCAHTSVRSQARYRRLQRFITRCPFKQDHLAALIMGFFEGSVVLAMDRTNWAFGAFEINILVLSVVYKGYSFPLFWNLLPHKGCSSAENRIDLINTFIQTFGTSRIQALVMDREFIGPVWLGFLEHEDITFHVRLRNNIKIGQIKGEMVSPQQDFDALKPYEKIELPERRKIGVKKEGMQLFVSATRSGDGNLVVVASNKQGDEALDRYKQRWGIETLFGCLKTRGFSLEETHLQDRQKISHLLVVLSLAFFWAFKIGEWLNDKAPIQLKTHKRKAISLFRYGLNALVMAKNAFQKQLLIPLQSSNPIPPTKNLINSLGYL
jgi:hypothetical protein